MTLTKPQRVELRAACETVERYLRLLGNSVTVHVEPGFVEVHDTWLGPSVDKTLFSAMKDALTSIDS